MTQLFHNYSNKMLNNEFILYQIMIEMKNVVKRHINALIENAN